MEFYPPSITEVYNTYQNLYIVVNIHILKKGYTITTKCSKKNKKEKIQKAWIECDKGGVFKSKRFGKKEIITCKD